MEAWLAKYALELLAVTIVALASGWVGLNKRQRRQLRESRAEARKLNRELGRVRREYGLALEFNLKDRWTIRELARMIRDLRKELGRPEGDILLEVYERSEAELNARRLSASLHTTSPPQIEDFLSDE